MPEKKCFVFCQAPNISRAAGEFQQSSLELTTTYRNSRSFQGTGGLWRIAVALVTPLVTPRSAHSTKGSVPVSRNRCLGILSRLYSVTMGRWQRIHQDWLGHSAEVFKTHSTKTILPLFIKTKRSAGSLGRRGWRKSRLEQTLFFKKRSFCQQIKQELTVCKMVELITSHLCDRAEVGEKMRSMENFWRAKVQCARQYAGSLLESFKLNNFRRHFTALLRSLTGKWVSGFLQSLLSVFSVTGPKYP